MPYSRREALFHGLFGTGAGLLSFATGLPIALFGPRQAAALGAAPDHEKATFLLAACSRRGEPLNANAPGSYGDRGIVHPPGPDFAPRPIRLGAETVVGAACWGELSAKVRQQTAFVHHATHNVVHADLLRTLAIEPSAAKRGLWLNALAMPLARRLGTSLTEPIVLSQAAALGSPRAPSGLRPTTLAAALLAEDGPLANLEASRERIWRAVLRAQRTTRQAFLAAEHLAIDHKELKERTASLQHLLAGIRQDDTAGQLSAALALMALKVAPIVVVHLPFGGDNHVDTDLATEATETLASIRALNQFFAAAAGQGLGGQLTVASFDTFGRSLAHRHLGRGGRDHNANHCVALLSGPKVTAGVRGGVARCGADFGAVASPKGASGLGAPTLGRGEAWSLDSLNRTVALACGVDASDWPHRTPAKQESAGALLA